MSAVDAISRLAAGASGACVFYAFASILTRLKGNERAVDREGWKHAQRLNGRAWTIVALAAIIYRPVHAMWLLGSPAGQLLSRSVDLIAASLGCLAFIIKIAAQENARGNKPKLVALGFCINCTVALAIVGATWVTR